MLSRSPALPEKSRVLTVSDALKRSARSLVLLSAFIGVAIFAALSMIAPRYESQADVAVVAKGTAAGSTAAMDPAAALTYVSALQSPFLLKRVADNLALGKSREFNSARGPVDLLDATLRTVGIGKPQRGESENSRVLTALINHLDVHAASDGRAIAVRVISIDPGRAAQIANAIADTFAKSLSQEAQIEPPGLAQAPDANSNGTKSPAHPALEARILSRAQVAPIPVFPEKVQLAALAALASLMFGVAWIVMSTALRGMPPRKVGQGPLKVTQVGPLVAEAPVEMETPEAEVLVRPKAKTPTGLLSEIDGAASDVAPPLMTFTEIDALASRLKARRPSGGGHRTLITSESNAVVPFDEALELAKVLADCGGQTILIDWSPRGDGIARTIGLDSYAGWNDLLSDHARFDSIIHRLPGTRAQVIPSGGAMRNGSYRLDANLLNLALDALDEVYDHIVVTGRHDEARALFECIEGRFDAAITVVPDNEEPSAAGGADIFIGFQVADIDVIRYRQPGSTVSPMAQRIALATRAREPVAQNA